MTLTSNWKRASGEERTEEYRTWRTECGLAGVCDVDQIEYRFENGHPYPAAVVELCVADPESEEIPGGVKSGLSPSPAFLDAVLAKVHEKRPQGAILRLLAQKLAVPLLVVVFIRTRLDEGVWVYRIGGHGWKHWTLGEYRSGLSVL